MGNTPSSEASRKPHKLSKPRVGNHASTAGLLSPSAPSVSSAARFSNSYLVGSLPIPPPEPSPVEPSTPVGLAIAVPGEDLEPAPSPPRKSSRRNSKRLSGLFRSKSSQSEQAARKTRMPSTGSGTNSSRPSRASSLVQDGGIRPLVRADSVQSSANRGSARHDRCSYDAQRLLDRNESPTEPPVPPLPNLDTSSQPQREDSWKAPNQHQATNSPVSRTNSELSLYTPMRRRSVIQTPGVATRAQSISNPVSTKSSFRYSHPPTPSQTRHNSIESNTTRRQTMPSPHAEFPSVFPELVTSSHDGEYRQLGVMKFGSLRITNGAPSPCPSPCPENDSDEEICTPIPGSRDENRTPTASRTTSQATEVSESFQILQPKPVLKIQSSVAVAFEDTVSPRTTLKMDMSFVAQGDHACNLTMSPIMDPLSPTLQTRSKHTADDDHLFDDSEDTPGNFPEALDVKDAPNAKPSPESIQLDRSQKATGSMARSDSGYVASPMSDQSRQPLSKADSGYSSNISLRSLHSLTGSRRKGRLSPEKATMDKSQPGSPALTISTLSKHEEEAEGSGDDKAPTPPPKNDVPTVATRSSTSTKSCGSVIRIPSLRSSNARDTQSPRPPIHRRAISADSVAGTPVSSAKSMASLDIGNGTHRARLQRFLSGSRKKGSKPHLVTEEVPSLPPDTERLQQYGGGFSMTHRRPPLRVHPSRDTLKTILSVGSTDLLQNEETEKKEEQKDAPPKTPRRRNFQMRSHSFTHAASMLSPRKQASQASLAHKSSRTMTSSSQHGINDFDHTTSENILEYEAAMTSTDSIRQSMGKSAFDQALAAPTTSTPRKPPIRPLDKDRRHQSPGLSLRSRSSAPDFRGTPLLPMSPSNPDFSKSPKTPPPVSMQTRGSKKSKHNHVTPPRRPRSTPPGGVVREKRPPLPQINTRDIIRSYPPVLNGPLSPGMASPRHTGYAGPHKMPSNPNKDFHLPMQRVTHGGQPHRGSAPVHVRSPNTGSIHPQYNAPHSKFQHSGAPRRRSSSDTHGFSQPRPLHYKAQPHGQDAWLKNQYRQRQVAQNAAQGYSHRPGQSSQGSIHVQNPPYRVLHSYNSPAYKGVPIWG